MPEGALSDKTAPQFDKFIIVVRGHVEQSTF